MRKFLLLLTLGALALLASGCVQMNMTSTIEKDGSGTMDMTISLSQVLTESMEELQAMNQDEGLEDLDEMMDLNRDEMQAKVKDHGVTIKKMENSVIDGRQTVQISLEFKDIEGMSFAMREFTSEDSGGLAIIDKGDGTYALRHYEYDWPPLEEEEESEDVSEEPAEMDPEMMGKQMELMGKLMSSLSELEVVMQITVPGDIVSSNAPIVEGRTSTWRIDQTNMMTAGTSMEPDIVFSAKGLKLKTVKE
jgi:hypothetical protein